MNIKCLLIIPLLLIVGFTKAQPFEYGIWLKGIGDNREFDRAFSEKGTIFGPQLGFEIGTTIDSVHSIRAGFNYFYEFGGEFMELKPDLLLYYSYQKNSWGLKFGAFPREYLMKYPLAIISDNFGYYNPTVDGILVNYHKRILDFSAFTDWTSRQSEIRREQFMVGISEIYRLGNFRIEAYSYLFHNGRRTVKSATDYIDDYMGSCTMVGYDFSNLVPLDVLTVKSGMLTSSHRNRMTSKIPVVNSSSYSEVAAGYKGFGAEVFLKFGEKHQFSHGDLYYNNAEKYVRTNLYFTPINTARVKARFTWSFHVANGNLDHQQQFILTYQLKT